MTRSSAEQRVLDRECDSRRREDEEACAGGPFPSRLHSPPWLWPGPQSGLFSFAPVANRQAFRTVNSRSKVDKEPPPADWLVS